MAYTSGKHAKFISDRSGVAYPYSERIKDFKVKNEFIKSLDLNDPVTEADLKVN